MPDDPPRLTFDSVTRVLAGSRGSVQLDPGPGLLVGRMMTTPGKLVPRPDLAAALALPDAVGSEADAVLRSHLKTVRVLAAALSGSAWTLRMRGQDAAGLVGPAKAASPATGT